MPLPAYFHLCEQFARPDFSACACPSPNRTFTGQARLVVSGKVPRTEYGWRDQKLCQYIRGQSNQARLGSAQVFRSRFAGPAICDDLEIDPLALYERCEPGVLDGADMDENVVPSTFRLNETETLLGVKPLHNSRIHQFSFPTGKRKGADARHAAAAVP